MKGTETEMTTAEMMAVETKPAPIEESVNTGDGVKATKTKAFERCPRCQRNVEMTKTGRFKTHRKQYKDARTPVCLTSGTHPDFWYGDRKNP